MVRGTVCDFWKCKEIITEGKMIFYRKGMLSHENYCSQLCLKDDLIDDLDIRNRIEGE